MSLARDDRYVTDAQGRALAGAQVYWCTQPATVGSTPPPSPLASLFTDLTGATPLAQPVLTDGFGHADAYMAEGALYTVAVYHPLYGTNPVVIPDQTIGGGGGGGTTVTTFAGIPTGPINGTNTVFTVVNGSTPLTAIPAQITAWLNFPLVSGVGYSLSIVSGILKITYSLAPQPATGGSPADAIYCQGIILS